MDRKNFAQCGRLVYAKVVSIRDGLKPWLKVVQSLATIAAIVLAGWWFLRQDLELPRLDVEHRVTSIKLSPDKQLLIVDAKLSNVGNVKLDLKCGKVKIYEILPRDQMLVNNKDACNVDERILEPGEDDQVHEEYTIPGNVSTIRVYTWFSNPARPGIGWDLTSFYNLGVAAIEPNAATARSPAPHHVRALRRQSSFHCDSHLKTVRGNRRLRLKSVD